MDSSGVPPALSHDPYSFQGLVLPTALVAQAFQSTSNRKKSHSLPAVSSSHDLPQHDFTSFSDTQRRQSAPPEPLHSPVNHQQNMPLAPSTIPSVGVCSIPLATITTTPKGLPLAGHHNLSVTKSSSSDISMLLETAPAPFLRIVELKNECLASCTITTSPSPPSQLPLNNNIPQSISNSSLTSTQHRIQLSSPTSPIAMLSPPGGALLTPTSLAYGSSNTSTSGFPLSDSSLSLASSAGNPSCCSTAGLVVPPSVARLHIHRNRSVCNCFPSLREELVSSLAPSSAKDQNTDLVPGDHLSQQPQHPHPHHQNHPHASVIPQAHVTTTPPNPIPPATTTATTGSSNSNNNRVALTPLSFASLLPSPPITIAGRIPPPQAQLQHTGIPSSSSMKSSGSFAPPLPPPQACNGGGPQPPLGLFPSSWGSFSPVSSSDSLSSALGLSMGMGVNMPREWSMT